MGGSFVKAVTPKAITSMKSTANFVPKTAIAQIGASHQMRFIGRLRHVPFLLSNVYRMTSVISVKLLRLHF